MKAQGSVNKRGIEELSSARQIPIANWFAVAVLPTQEAFAPVRRMTQIILMAAVLLVFAASAAAWWLLRRQLAQVRKERDYYDAQMRQSSDGIFIVDPQNQKILDANLQLGEILGYGPGEMVGLELGDVVAVDAEQRNKQMAAIRNQKRVQVGERNFKRKDGTTLEVEVSASSIRSGGTEAVMINVRDITARKQDERALKESEERYRALSTTLAEQVENEVAKRLERERQLAQQQAVLIQQSKLAELGNMTGAIAHQWKQPLNAIGLMAQELPDAYEYGELDKAAIERYAEHVMDQVRFMSQTIEDFRNFYKPSLRHEPFNLKRALDSLGELLRAQLSKHNIQLHIDAQADLEITGFASEFKQVVLNLVNNAHDACMERKIHDGRIDINAAREGDWAIVRIRDNAGGIPEGLLPDKLFEPFVTTKGEAGTGIGLSLSRTIICDKMGGRFSARNLENGAEFTISAPLSRADETRP